MKNQIKFRSVILFIIAMIISTGLYAQTTDTSKVKEVKIKTSAICGMCKTAIEKAVNKLSGIVSSDLNKDTKICTVKYNTDELKVEQIRHAINKAGYDADDQPADVRAYNKLPKCCKKDGEHK